MSMDTNQTLTFTSHLHLHRLPHGQLELRVGHAPPTATGGHVPRIARLMALAIRFEELIRLGEVTDYADLARLGHVTRARVTQIMNLLMLAPDLQEQILFLPLTQSGRDNLKEWQVREIASQPLWTRQRRRWRQLGLPNSTMSGTGSVVETEAKVGMTTGKAAELVQSQHRKH